MPDGHTPWKGFTMPEFERNSKSVKSKKKKKKQNIFVSILSGLFPWKGDAKGDVIRKIVFLISLAVLLTAIYIIVDFYFIKDVETDLDIQRWNELKDSYTGNDKITIQLSDDDTIGSSGEEVEILEQYQPFYEENNDFVGWITVGSFISNPVTQADDNEYYLKHTFDKNDSENGTIFADCEDRFTPTERPHNTILYGHNLITRNYFQPLAYYRSQGIEYLKDNPTVEFDTLYEKGTYKIFSVMLVNTTEDYGEVFDYYNHCYFKNKTEFDNYVAECLDRSYYYTGVDVEYGDELLTLSTCDFSFTRYDMRIVIVARRVRESESPLVDTSLFIDNSGMDIVTGTIQRKMFDLYYSTFGVAWEGRTWDKSYVKDFKNYDDDGTEEKKEEE